VAAEYERSSFKNKGPSDGPSKHEMTIFTQFRQRMEAISVNEMYSRYLQENYGTLTMDARVDTSHTCIVTTFKTEQKVKICSPCGQPSVRLEMKTLI
jgi:hypothetical protein